MPTKSKPLALSYRTPPIGPKQSPRDPAWATALALPGVCGFCLLAGALMFDSRIAWNIGPRRGILLWFVAFACAVFSVHFFRGRRKSAWVMFCLALNWLGVLFTLTPPGWIVMAVAIAAATH